MRELIQFIQEGYKDTKKEFKPIYSDSRGDETHNTRYDIETSSDKPGHYSPDHSGTTHTVSWDSKNGSMSTGEKIRTVSDAKNLHNHALQNRFKPGDVVKNVPAHDNEKLKKLYKKSGFGDSSSRWNAMAAIVKKHPDDHEDESVRGKHYLHPLDHNDVCNTEKITEKDKKSLGINQDFKILEFS